MKKMVIMLIAVIALCGAAYDAVAADSLVVFRNGTPTWGTWYGSHTQPSPVYLNGITTTTTQFGWSGIGAPNQVPLIGDVNGDGIDDIVLLQVVSGNYNWVAGHSTVSGGVGSFSSATTSGITSFGTAAGSLGSFLADINGDGKKDAVTVNAGNAWYAQYSASGLGGGSFYGPVGPNLYGFGLIPNGGIQVGDFNGDGQADMCSIVNNDNWHVKWCVKLTSGGVLGADAAEPNGLFGYMDGTFLVGDINGDGRTDGICVRPNGNIAGLLYWTAKYAEPNGVIGGTVGGATPPDTSCNFGRPGDVPFVADINGDGKADIGVRRLSNINWNIYWYVGLTTGTGQLYAGQVGDDIDSFGANGDIALVGKLGTAPAVSATNCVYALDGDFNGDCAVTFKDFAILAKNWMVDCIAANPGNPPCVVPNY